MYNLCIIKPNKNAFSETFIQEHINRLAGNKTVLYGGAFPVYDNEGKFLIKSKLGILSYLIQKRILKKTSIKVRTDALVTYFKTQKTDVVLAEYGMVGAMVTEACQLAGVPLVIHFHGADVHHRATVASYFALYQKAFKYASYFVAVSTDMVEALKQLGAPPDKIILAPCGVDTTKFTQVDVLNAGPAFLAIGRFVEKKSPDSVVKAFKLVHQKFPDATLTMVGQGPLFEAIQTMVEQLGLNQSVNLTGVLKTEQIRELMAKSRCFVQHSVTAKNGDMEGTPVTILEAGSSGLPIVSTLHAGIKEAVVNGKTGYLVAEHDIEGMAEKMMLFAANAKFAEQVGSAGREHILKNYDISYSIAKLNKALKRSITGN
ncbi:glycosyltransferase [Mucilaginibacter paludis]|uniref:Glycosyl transferase group 1 n=1 Tax=Mucilaginibacter paludis DSM 18603 TaxID=714943 RepID=H1Y000_9SPHI|nr:glycosyltransferase [Mucilaginibacter paludis]EHQ27842.1 glycosyl transferase group 1 [Mucilaginibacter paludis DSM 18603]